MSSRLLTYTLTVEARKIPYVRSFLCNLLHMEEYAKTCNTQSPADITLKNSAHVDARTHIQVSSPFGDDTLHHGPENISLLMRYCRALVKHAISGVCVSVKQTRQFRLKWSARSDPAPAPWGYLSVLLSRCGKAGVLDGVSHSACLAPGQQTAKSVTDWIMKRKFWIHLSWIARAAVNVPRPFIITLSGTYSRERTPTPDLKPSKCPRRSSRSS